MTILLNDIQDLTLNNLASFGSIFNGMNTDREIFKETLILSDHVEALNFSDFMDSSTYSSELFPLAQKLASFLEDLVKKLDEAEKTMQTVQKVSELDIKEYLSTDTIPMATVEDISRAVDKSLENKEALYVQINLKAFMKSPVTAI